MCHGLFAVAALTMVVVMFTGMGSALGRLAAPWSWLANLALIAQFPLGHSRLLTSRGRAFLRRLAPTALATDLSATTNVMIASVQDWALFSLWTPSRIALWQAHGGVFWLMTALCAAAWVLLDKASMDAGIDVQTGA